MKRRAREESKGQGRRASRKEGRGRGKKERTNDGWRGRLDHQTRREKSAQILRPSHVEVMRREREREDYSLWSARKKVDVEEGRESKVESGARSWTLGRRKGEQKGIYTSKGERATEGRQFRPGGFIQIGLGSTDTRRERKRATRNHWEREVKGRKERKGATGSGNPLLSSAVKCLFGFQ